MVEGVEGVAELALRAEVDAAQVGGFGLESLDFRGCVGAGGGEQGGGACEQQGRYGGGR